LDFIVPLVVPGWEAVAPAAAEFLWGQYASADTLAQGGAQRNESRQGILRFLPFARSNSAACRKVQGAFLGAESNAICRWLDGATTIDQRKSFASGELR